MNISKLVVPHFSGNHQFHYIPKPIFIIPPEGYNYYKDMKQKALDIIEEYYGNTPELKELLLAHSEAVAAKAKECAEQRDLTGSLDMEFVEEASLLHDLGIFLTDAPSIHCHGSMPYICHGIAGAGLLELEDMPRHARVAERHTGAGLTAAEIEAQKLPLPRTDMLPETMEEKLICYADKFFSKSGDPKKEKSLEKVMEQMKSHGEDTLARFMELHRLFGSQD